jgi:diguanylate cyclase (GGDEF)-like protein
MNRITLTRIDDRLQYRIIRENLKRLLYFSGFLALFLPLLLFLLPVIHEQSSYRSMIFVSIIIFEVIDIFTYLVSYRLTRRRHTKITQVLIYSFWFVYYVWGCLFSFFGMLADSNFTCYTVFLLAYSFIPFLGHIEYTATMLMQIVLMFMTCLNLSFTTSQVVYLLILNVCFLLLSRCAYEYEISNLVIANKLMMSSKNADEDPLTGLNNRRGLDKRISPIMSYCIRDKGTVSVLILDIDNFKKYNDCFGHPEGDHCLQMVAETLKNTARRSTDITARIGGEEFLVFVHNSTETEPVMLAEKIRTNIAALKIKHAPTVGENAIVTVSIGVASMTPTDPGSFDKLYTEADKALYCAKKSGRNTVVCGGHIYSNKTEFNKTA